MKTSLVLPAKGTSERVKNKNLLSLNGKSLVRIACETMASCSEVDDLFLDTESTKIAAEAQGLPINIINRPKSMASNSTSGNDLILFECNSIPKCDLIIQICCTAPLLKSKTIDSAIKKFKEN